MTIFQSFRNTVVKNLPQQPSMSKEKKKRKADWQRLKGTTNFYPTYVDGNLDKVTPTAATYSTQFQTVIPRYDLSMSETRNAGTGPTFLETAYQSPSKSAEQDEQPKEIAPEAVEEKFKPPRHKKKKIRTDFWE